MRNLTKILVLIGVVSFISISCEEEEESLETIKKQLIGSWKEVEPCNDGTCDTIVFNEDNTIELYVPLEGNTYELVSNDSIIFTNESGRVMRKKFMFLESDVLIIYNFIDKSITHVVKDIKFKKL